MKKRDLMKVWGAMKGAKFGKMSDDAKMKFVMMVGKLTLVVDDYEKFRNVTLEECKKDYPHFDELQERAQLFEEWNNRSDEDKKQGTPPEMTRQEYVDFVKTVLKYNKSCEAVLDKELDTDVDVTYDRVTQSEFRTFMNSNDFSGGDAWGLSVVMCDLE